MIQNGRGKPVDSRDHLVWRDGPAALSYFGHGTLERRPSADRLRRPRLERLRDTTLEEARWTEGECHLAVCTCVQVEHRPGPRAEVDDRAAVKQLQHDDLVLDERA